MVDSFTKKKRASILRAVKSNGNRSTELKLIEIFKRSKITGWRRKYDLYGSPDFVFPAKRIAVFTDGCFWHGHNCRRLTPKDNAKYWQNKIKSNKEHDKKVTKTLKSLGWRVARIWECAIKKGAPRLMILLNS